ncbi:MAG: 50S ribosome-binding GTPase, partial [Nitrospiraceae bacterium]|nr:50S ribosome-binding GTPase [Nitrospiraceae bacterium]
MNRRQRHGHDRHARKIALLGNPNVGKSVIFGLLTGKYVTVSNYPGTTVEITRSSITLDMTKFLLIDTPGVNSLVPMSEDEKVTRDILLYEKPDTVIQVADAKNLKRTLFITLQLAEMGLPSVLALNMTDEASERGISIDTGMLKNLLGIDVISTIAPQRKGIKELRESMLNAKTAAVSLAYHPAIESAVAEITALLPQAHISSRSLALMILSRDDSLNDWLKEHLDEKHLKRLSAIADKCDAELKTSSALVINKARLELAAKISGEVVKKTDAPSWRPLVAVGNLSMHPVYGIPIVLLVLYCIYQFVGVFGAGILVDFFENTIFGQYINPAAVKLVKTIVPWKLVQDMLVGEYGT